MIPVKRIQEAILSMGGHQGRECCELLCMAIYEAVKQQPVMPQMKVIWAAVKKKACKEKATAVSKVLERAVADLWENEGRKVPGAYQRSREYDKPSPKEFIRVAAQHLWDGGAAEEKGEAVLMSSSAR